MAATGTALGYQWQSSTDGGTTWTDYTVGANGNGVHVDHHALVFDANGKLLDGSSVHTSEREYLFRVCNTAGCGTSGPWGICM